MGDPTTDADLGNASQGIHPGSTESEGKQEEPHPKHEECDAQTHNNPSVPPRKIRRFLAWIWGGIKSPDFTNPAIALATIIIAAATVLTYCEVHQGSAQTDKIIAADDRLAGAMEGVLGQSADSFNATVAQFRLEQRAWIGITDFHVVGNIEAGKPIKALAVLVNSGHTVARDVKVNIIVHTNVGPLDISAYAKNPDEKPAAPFGLNRGIFNLFPNQPMNLPGETGSPNAEAVNAIRVGIRMLYAFGEVTYTDVFDVPHVTKFCGVYMPTPNVVLIETNAHFSTCDTYNYAD